MCNDKSPIRARKSRAPPNPARKSRTKTRKPKYLSLKLQLSTQNQTEANHKQNPINVMPRKQQLINLFPLHPENQVQEHEDQVFDHVAFLFETATDDASTSLHAILDSATTSDEGSPQSPSQTYGYRWEEQQEGSSLMRSAMKSCKERDVSEERWVSYWEVVEKKEQEEVSSNCSAVVGALEKKMSMRGDDDRKARGLVGLKLDYEEIMNAWSDKRPLYIQGQSPQTVPDLLDAPNGQVERCGNVWEVPELSSIKMKEKEDNKSGQREASVLRYKEKRQSRLFSKRIRYQVRKLNADKRPRLKGRFIKRDGEE